MFALCSRTDIFLFDLFFHTSAIFRVAGSIFIPAPALFQPFFPFVAISHLKKRVGQRILARRRLSFFRIEHNNQKKKKISKLNFHNKSTLKPVAVFPLQML